MAFSVAGKLLELIEEVVSMLERQKALPANMTTSDISEMQRKIWELKQRKEFK